MAADDKPGSTFGTAAYGGDNWSQRYAAHHQELGAVDVARAREEFVTLGPRRILMVGCLPQVQGYFEEIGIECLTTLTDELVRATGNIGCLTGVLHRTRAT